MGFFFQDLSNNVTGLIVTSAVASVLTIVLFMVLRWSPFSRSYLQSRPWSVLLWVAVLVLGTIVPSVFLTEQLGIDLPEEQKQLLSRMMSTPWGYFVVGLAVPLAEEMVFRGALLRTLLKIFSPSPCSPLPLGGSGWGRRGGVAAIALSALVFAAVHGNLAQGLHAFLIGLLLGWLYWRSGSIVPGLVFHWVNNTIAYVLERLYPGIDDVRLVDLCGSELRVWLYVGYSLLIFIPALYQLYIRLGKK